MLGKGYFYQNYAPTLSNAFNKRPILACQLRGKSRFPPKKFFFKWANPGLFFVYFRSFQTNITILQQIYVKKCPSSIRCWDSNPQPLERESLPFTLDQGSRPKNPEIPKKFVNTHNRRLYLFCFHAT